MFAVIFLPNFALQSVMRSEFLISSQLQPGEPHPETVKTHFNGFDPLEKTVKTVSPRERDADSGLKPGANQRLEISKPFHSSAVALIDSSPANVSKAIVLECTEVAKAAGVCAGLTAPQAMARCRELVLKPRSPAAEQEAVNILLQTAYAFSPNIESTAPGVCTIDLRGLAFGSSRGNETHSKKFQIPNFKSQIDQSLLTSAATKASDCSAQQSFDFFPDGSTGFFLFLGRGQG